MPSRGFPAAGDPGSLARNVTLIQAVQRTAVELKKRQTDVDVGGVADGDLVVEYTIYMRLRSFSRAAYLDRSWRTSTVPAFL